MVRSASAPITASPPSIASAPTIRRGGNGSLTNEPRQNEAAERGAGRLDDGAVAKRHVDVAEIAP